jgi:hypothetical protein
MSDGLQNFTAEPVLQRTSPSHIRAYNALIVKDQWIVDFCAMSGMTFHADGKPEQISIEDFSHNMGITRQTFYNRRNAIPDFWKIVDARRFELYGPVRSAIFKGMSLKAMAGNAEAAKYVDGTWGNWQPPAQKHEIAVGGLADLANLARNKEIISGEVVEPEVKEIPAELPTGQIT